MKRGGRAYFRRGILAGDYGKGATYKGLMVSKFLVKVSRVHVCSLSNCS